MHQAYAAAESARNQERDRRRPERRVLADGGLRRGADLLQLPNRQRLSPRELDWARKWIHHWAHRSSSAATRLRAAMRWISHAVASGPAWAKADSRSPTFRFLDLARVAACGQPHASSASRKAPSLPRSDWVPIARARAQDLLKTLQRAG